MPSSKDVKELIELHSDLAKLEAREEETCKVIGSANLDLHAIENTQRKVKTKIQTLERRILREVVEEAQQ